MLEIQNYFIYQIYLIFLIGKDINIENWNSTNKFNVLGNYGFIRLHKNKYNIIDKIIKSLVLMYAYIYTTTYWIHCLEYTILSLLRKRERWLCTYAHRLSGE